MLKNIWKLFKNDQGENNITYLCKNWYILIWTYGLVKYFFVMNQNWKLSEVLIYIFLRLTDIFRREHRSLWIGSN